MLLLLGVKALADRWRRRLVANDKKMKKTMIKYNVLASLFQGSEPLLVRPGPRPVVLTEDQCHDGGFAWERPDAAGARPFR